MNWNASATFVAVLVLFLAAIGVATLVVAAWVALVAWWEDRRRVEELRAAHRAAVAAQATYPLPSQRTSSSASDFGSIDGSGYVRVVGGKQR